MICDPVRVLLADSNEIYTELLSSALQKDRSIEIVGTATTSSQIRTDVLRHKPDVLVTSVALSDGANSGLDILRDSLSQSNHTQAIVLLDSGDAETVVQAFRAGAHGIFCRNEPVKTLCKCIRVVHSGQIWANTQQIRFALAALANAPVLHPRKASRLDPLSDREREVVSGLVQGLSNRDIAHQLNLSHHTVKNYVFRIFEKVGVSSRIELMSNLLHGDVHRFEN